MTNIGRNDPCPCGSGKKYKKCHGGPNPPASPRAAGRPAPVRLGPDHLASELAPDQTSANAKLAGFPGQQQHWAAVNYFKPEADKPSSPAGHPGDYRVVFVLAKPGHAPVPDRDVNFDLGQRGDSHISLNAAHAPVPGAKGEIKIMHIDTVANGRPLQFSAYPNARGFISRIEATLPADSFADADTIASRAMSPFLSLSSSTLNVPVSVYQTEITEARTGNRRVTITTPFYESAPLPVAPNGVSDEFLWFAALYREALNTNSPLYRFLCLYKIIEGIVVRRTVMKARPPKERVPNDPAEFNGWLHALFPVRPEHWDQMALDTVFKPDVIGRSVGDIRDKDLRPLRNDVGHMFDDSDKSHGLWVDDAEQVQRVHHWLPITVCIARLMMKNDFPREFLPGLDEHRRRRAGR
jgi:hypothetical protein